MEKFYHIAEYWEYLSLLTRNQGPTRTRRSYTSREHARGVRGSSDRRLYWGDSYLTRLDSTKFLFVEDYSESECGGWWSEVAMKKRQWRQWQWQLIMMTAARKPSWTRVLPRTNSLEQEVHTGIHSHGRWGRKNSRTASWRLEKLTSVHCASTWIESLVIF